MKKYTYEITIEAEDEQSADSRMDCLGVLATGVTVQKKPESNYPLTEEEIQMLAYFRKGGRVGKLTHLIIGDVMQNIFQKDKGHETQKN